MLKLTCSMLLALGLWGNAQAQQKEVYQGYQGITDPAQAKAAWLKDQEKAKTKGTAAEKPTEKAASANAKAAEQQKAVKRDAAYQARERELQALKARRGAASEAHKKQ